MVKSRTTPPSAPNILVFFTDDHAQWAMGAYGNPDLQTPSLDYLAAGGVRMENSFTPTPVCSPGRACFLTGRLASQHGIHDYLSSTDPRIHNRDWLAGETLLPEILAANGYRTGLVGKWHLGADERVNPAFEYWFSLSGDYPYHHFGLTRYSDNGCDAFIQGYPTEILTEKAISFLRNKNADNPFFLYVGYTATHSPWAEQPERLVAAYRDSSFSAIPDGESYPFGEPALESLTVDASNEREARAQYYAAVNHIDESIGRLVGELEALGLRENTLIIYTADHGLNCGHHGFWGKGNGTLPLNMLEESIRVPLILNLPGRLPENQVFGQMVDHTDLFQTVLEASGARIHRKQAHKYPGKSFWRLIAEGAAMAGKDIQFGEYGPLRMARTDRYKLLVRYPNDPGDPAGVTQLQFFDLAADPHEDRDLSAEGAYQTIIADLQAAMVDFFWKLRGTW